MKIENLLKEIPVLETERLLLRKVALTDLEDIFEFSTDQAGSSHDVGKEQFERRNVI